MTENVKKKLLFIVNPVSGKGRGSELIPLFHKYFDDQHFELFIEQSQGKGHSTKIVNAYKNRGVQVVVAVGGDGTVNEIGGSLVGTNMVLGIIPTGSGNGLARHLGIPMEIGKSLKCIQMMNVISIDTVRFNDHRFLNVAGIGFDAEVSWNFAGSERRGWMNYARIILGMVMKITTFPYQLKYGDSHEEGSAVMISFANSSQYGNNARIAPNADIQDGKIDICILKSMNFFRLFPFFFSVMTGSIRNSSYFKSISTGSLEMTGIFKRAHIDGEPIELNGRLKIEVHPMSLNVICP